MFVLASFLYIPFHFRRGENACIGHLRIHCHFAIHVIVWG